MSERPPETFNFSRSGILKWALIVAAGFGLGFAVPLPFLGEVPAFYLQQLFLLIAGNALFIAFITYCVTLVGNRRRGVERWWNPWGAE